MANPLLNIYLIPIKNLNIQEIQGKWKEGYALDLHTVSSLPIFNEQNEIIGWDTKRPDIAERLYRLKYWSDIRWVDSIADAASNFLLDHLNNWSIDLLVPAPPSNTDRKFQPVYELAKSIGSKVKIVVDYKAVTKIKSTTELKGEEDSEKRFEMLKDAFLVKDNYLLDKNVLLFDDLFRSGETLNAICDVITNKGKAKNIYVLTITKTRTKR